MMLLRTKTLSAGATIALGLFTVMCGERPGAKIKLSPVAKSAAGTASGSAAAGGRGATGMSGSTGGSANGRVGASGEPGAGEGGGAAEETGEGSGGSGSKAGTAGAGAGGGTGASDGSGGTAAIDSAGGATGGGDAGSAGDPSSGSGGLAAGGTAGQGGLGGAGASAGAGAGGVAGAGGACGTKTSCCLPSDPPCLDGCPSNASYCCNPSAGARIQCDPANDFGSVVCINPCDGNSYGTAPCSTSCLQPNDPPCSDPTWDDICLTGGFASCSDATVGYRGACNSDGTGLYYSYVSCTCDPDS